jgi:HEAT repeat protein
MASAVSGGLLLAVLLLGPLPGCVLSLPAEPRFDSPVPQQRFAAIRRAGRELDRAAVPDLIRQLGSEDTLVRLAAIDALRRITGETLGFDPDAPDEERRRAIERWAAWLDGAPITGATGGPGEPTSDG